MRRCIAFILVVLLLTALLPVNALASGPADAVSDAMQKVVSSLGGGRRSLAELFRGFLRALFSWLPEKPVINPDPGYYFRHIGLGAFQVGFPTTFAENAFGCHVALYHDVNGCWQFVKAYSLILDGSDDNIYAQFSNLEEGDSYRLEVYAFDWLGRRSEVDVVEFTLQALPLNPNPPIPVVDPVHPVVPDW